MAQDVYELVLQEYHWKTSYRVSTTACTRHRRRQYGLQLSQRKRPEP
jgi:hypothetical protein